jgi:hypothetical protein
MVLSKQGAMVRDLTVPGALDLPRLPDADDDDRSFRLAAERRVRTSHERLSAPWVEVREGA